MRLNGLRGAAVLGLVLTVLFWFDPLFIPLALLGPLVVGSVAAWSGLPWRWPAVVVVVAGLGALISDYVVNQEDVAFHAGLTIVMLVLALVSWRMVARRRRGRLARA
jgi:hypothetical protein